MEKIKFYNPKKLNTQEIKVLMDFTSDGSYILRLSNGEEMTLHEIFINMGFTQITIEECGLLAMKMDCGWVFEKK